MEKQQTLYDVRVKACSGCTSYNKIMDTCQQTEKLIAIYAKRPTNGCPLNRWPQ